MIKYTPVNSNLNKVSPALVTQMEEAQSSLLENEFKDLYQIIELAGDKQKIKTDLFGKLKSKDIQFCYKATKLELEQLLYIEAESHSLPKEIQKNIIPALLNQILLIFAYKNSDSLIDLLDLRIEESVKRFPKKFADLECGKNPGDVIDPFLVAAASILIYSGDFSNSISGMTSHRAFMVLEDLIGHLHEDMIGKMRGNVRVPEPNGKGTKEKLDFMLNPFPGADVMQPPLFKGDVAKMFQVKNKTGSAKGGDGKRLGDQMKLLIETYKCAGYYMSILGTTLQGHRSMSGVLQTENRVIVQVGEQAFKSLTRLASGPETLLSLYHVAFDRVSAKTGYSISQIVKGMISEVSRNTTIDFEKFISKMLKDVISGEECNQDSRYYKK